MSVSEIPRAFFTSTLNSTFDGVSMTAVHVKVDLAPSDNVSTAA